MLELFDMFPDDKAAMEWLEGNVWPDGRIVFWHDIQYFSRINPASHGSRNIECHPIGLRRCPRCGYKYACASKHPSMPYYCSECSKRFSVRIGTVMEQSKISYRNWAIATYLLATRPKGISRIQPRRDLGISQSAAWFLLHRLRGAWRTLAGPDLTAGPVEVDQMYLGGREMNKHADKKGKGKKTAAVGIRDRHAGIVRAMPVPEATAARLMQSVEFNADPEAEKFTDENRAYADLKNRQTVNHGDGEYARGGVHVNGMESFWALVRRGYNGAFHRIEPKHPHRCISEFAGRLSDRAAGAVERTGNIVRNLVGKRLTYRQLAAGKSLCGATWQRRAGPGGHARGGLSTRANGGAQHGKPANHRSGEAVRMPRMFGTSSYARVRRAASRWGMYQSR